MKQPVKTAPRIKRKKVRNNNPTTNCSIPEAIFKRECKEYDEGKLPHEHDLYIGERL